MTNTAEWTREEAQLYAGEIDEETIDADDVAETEPVSEDEKRKWEAQLHRLHKASGHSSVQNLVTMLVDAQVPQWKIQMARSFHCPTCEELRPGGISSRQIPPAAMRPLPAAWEQVGVDVGEWLVPGKDLKLKFLLMIDYATHFRVTETLFTYPYHDLRIENAELLIKTFALRWLQWISHGHESCALTTRDPCWLRDSPTSWQILVSKSFPRQRKRAGRTVSQSAPLRTSAITVAMATGAVNNTEFHCGYTSTQWAFGKQATLSDEELKQQLSMRIDRQQQEFLRLLNQRELAEDSARKARARVVMSKLKNSTARQPIRTFSMAEPVYIWRKFLPSTIYAGRRGGQKLAAKPRWVGPGRRWRLEACGVGDSWQPAVPGICALCETSD